MRPGRHGPHPEDRRLIDERRFKITCRRGNVPMAGEHGMAGIVIERDVEIAARRLAEATDAEAVILFGSRARGDHRPDSDWDLCVVLPDDVRPQQFTPSKLWELLSDLDASIQVYPLRRSVFEARRDDVDSVSHDIAREGYAIIGSLEPPSSITAHR
jgi:predicted nucleotidyltransferase